MSRRLVFHGWRRRHQPALDEARHNLRIFVHDRLAVVGAAVIASIVVVAVFAPWIAPYPDEGRGASHIASRLQAPSAQHLFGTDEFGGMCSAVSCSGPASPSSWRWPSSAAAC